MPAVTALPHAKLVGLLRWKGYEFKIYETPAGSCVVLDGLAVAKAQRYLCGPVPYWQARFRKHFPTAAALTAKLDELRAMPSTPQYLASDGGVLRTMFDPDEVDPLS